MKKEVTLDLTSGLNYFGNEFDYTGPMIATTHDTSQATLPTKSCARWMRSAEITTKGVTEKELANAKVQYRSNFYSQLESSFGEGASTLRARTLPRRPGADQFTVDAV